MKHFISYILILISLVAKAQYMGTGSVTQGFATTITNNLYTCTGGRIAGIGTITATDNSTWTVPAAVNYTNNNFPFASNLYNSCIGATYANSNLALAALTGTDIVTIDSSGEVITAYIFADNYFEMYINGIAVGKDNVPYTQFNSDIIRFKVNKPFTIAMLLVDWEENLGLGSENNNGFTFHAGDGGMVAVFKDASNNIIAKTDGNWKAQTFYTSPITDLSCPSEVGSSRLSSNCSTTDSNNGAAYFGLHWNRPSNWTDAVFMDNTWPNATVYTNATIGVSNKPSYTNFTNIFDDPQNDAQFIWSTNVILDNEVIVRYTVSSTASVNENYLNKNIVKFYPNPAKGNFKIGITDDLKFNEITGISIYNSNGEKVFESEKMVDTIDTSKMPSGLYLVKVTINDCQITEKLIVE